MNSGFDFASWGWINSKTLDVGVARVPSLTSTNVLPSSAMNW
jgi:hypothetical protein